MKGWKKMTFADVATKFFSGGTPPTKDSSLWDGDIQWITSKWLNERLYLSDGEKNINEKGLRSSATKLVKARSLILATRVGVGKVSINEIDLAINQDLLGIEIDEHNYSLEFLAYQLRSQKPQDYISLFKRGATIQGVTKDCIKSIELNIPPLPEQRKIANVLSMVQKASEHQDKLIRITTELKKALMQKLFTEGTRGELQKETEIGLVSESWEVVELGKCLLKTQYGISAKGKEKGNVPILRMTNQKDGYISCENLQYINISEKELNKFKVNMDDVIFNRTNSFELVGRTAIFKISDDYVFASYLIRLVSSQPYNVYKYAINTPYNSTL
jgi:type I restriction enzyme S subunit